MEGVRARGRRRESRRTSPAATVHEEVRSRDACGSSSPCTDPQGRNSSRFSAGSFLRHAGRSSASTALARLTAVETVTGAQTVVERRANVQGNDGFWCRALALVRVRAQRRGRASYPCPRRHRRSAKARPEAPFRGPGTRVPRRPEAGISGLTFDESGAERGLPEPGIVQKRLECRAWFDRISVNVGLSACTGSPGPEREGACSFVSLRSPGSVVRRCWHRRFR